MGISDFVEEAAGAFAAEAALEAVNPNAGFLAKAAVAVAGFEGVSKVQQYLGGDQSGDAGDQPTCAQNLDDGS